MSILPASCSLLSADAFGYFSRSSVWPWLMRAQGLWPLQICWISATSGEIAFSTSISGRTCRDRTAKVLPWEKYSSHQFLQEVHAHIGSWSPLLTSSGFSKLLQETNQSLQLLSCLSLWWREAISPLLIDLILVDTRSSKEPVSEGSGSMHAWFCKGFKVPLQSGCGAFE